MLKFYSLILAFLFCTLAVYSQPNPIFTLKLNLPKIKVDSIIISGNEQTETFIIQRELTFKKGDLVDSLDLDYNKERVFSLRLFNHVEIITTKSCDSLNVINVKVSEGWYIYPIPFVQRVDQDWNKISYGLNLLVMNFRGRNENISAKGIFGYDPGWALSYSIPYFLREQSISLDFSFNYLYSKNRSNTAKELYGDDFKQRIFSFNTVLAKRFNLYNRAFLALGYQAIVMDKFIAGINGANDKTDSYATLGIGYIRDTRDLRQFPTEGSFLSISLFENGIISNGADFRVLNFDSRAYFKVAPIVTIKNRFYNRSVFGANSPLYENNILTVTNRVRGSNVAREGKDVFLFQTEASFLLLSEKRLKFSLPLVPDKLTDYRLGFEIHTFYDCATVNNNKFNDIQNNFEYGFGAGISILVLPYNVLRCDLAIDRNMKLMGIIDASISF